MPAAIRIRAPTWARAIRDGVVNAFRNSWKRGRARLVLAKQVRQVARLAAAMRAAERSVRRAGAGPDRRAAERALARARIMLDRRLTAAAADAGRPASADPVRVGRALARAARGRGAAGWRARLASRVRMNPPASPSARRVVVTAAAGLGGLAAGVEVLGGGTRVNWTAVGLAAAAVLAAVRAVWSPRVPRAPPLRVLADVVRAARHGGAPGHDGSARHDSSARRAAVRVTGLFVAAGAAPWVAPVVWGWVGGAWSFVFGLPNYVATVGVLAAASTGVLVHRYVLRRQLSNQEKGVQVRPWVAAARSAALVFVITAGYRIVTAIAQDAKTYTWLFGTVAVATPIIATANAAVQAKEMGRARVIKAVLAGLASLSASALTVWLVSTGGTSPTVTAWLTAMLLSGLLVSGNTPFGDYLAAWFGKRRLAKNQEKLDELARRPKPDEKEHTRLQRGWGQAVLDYLTFNKVDTRVLLRKAVDTVLNTVFTFIIMNPWSGTDSPKEVMLRAGVVAVLLWLTGKIRDRDEWRAGDQPRDSIYGYQSPRRMRSPLRSSPRDGDRLGQRADEYRAQLHGVIRWFHLGDPHRRMLDRQLAKAMAAALFARLTAQIPGRADEWPPVPGTGEFATAVNDALAAERTAQNGRVDQHRIAVAHTLPVLAADPAALARVAYRLRNTGDPRDAEVAEVLEFQLALGEELIRLALKNEPVQMSDGLERPLLPSGAGRHDDWITRLAEQIGLRYRKRRGYLAGPLRDLLNAINNYYTATNRSDHPDAVRARLALARLELQVNREGMRKPPVDPLSQAMELHLQRRSSVKAAEQAERKTRLEGHGDTARLAARRELVAGHGLLGAAAGLVAEVQYLGSERTEVRRRWAAAIEASIAARQPSTRPATLLEVLLALAGRDRPVTASELAAEFGGARATWQRKLNQLDRLGALDGNRKDGYRARMSLAKLWREASPRTRHALRADPTLLPGGHLLAPLTRARPTGTAEEMQAAYPGLLRLLTEAGLAPRRPADGLPDDLGITWRRLANRGYNAAGGLGFPSSRPGSPLTQEIRSAWARTAVPIRQQWLLRARVRAAAVATRNLLLTLLAAADLRAAGMPYDVVHPLVSAAAAGQLTAFAQLVEAHKWAGTELARVRAYPHQTTRTLRAAERALAAAPGTDPVPEFAGQWLRENTQKMVTARRALARGVTEARLARARTLLERHDQDRAYAWSRTLWRTLGGWHVMQEAREAAEALERYLPESRILAAPPTRPNQIPAAGAEVLPQPGTSDATSTGPGGNTAVTTLRGPGNRTNEDAGATFTLPDGTAVLIVADGLSRTHRAEEASFAAVTAARRELARTDRAGRDPARTIRDAFQAAADALANAYASDNPHRRADATPYATTLLVAMAGPDGRITVGWVGDSRAYLLTPTANRLLTTDHIDREIMSRFLSPDFRPRPQVRAMQTTDAGLLLATTDGLHDHLPEPADLAAALDGETDPTAVTQVLTTAARAAGSNDDTTAAAAVINRPDKPASATPPGRTSLS